MDPRRIYGIDNKVLRGTTTVAMVCKDGVVIGADTRVISGYFIAHKKGRKIFAITPRLVLTIAGVVADAQAIVDTLKYNVKLYELKRKRRMNARSAARLLSLILFQHRMFPLYTELIISGMDDDEFALYRLDILGSLVKDDYSSTGSGSPIAMGVLEDGYRRDMSLEEGIDLVARSLITAMSRDIGSGNDFDIMALDRSGTRELSLEEKGKLVKKHLAITT